MLVILALIGIPLWFLLGVIARVLMRQRAIAAIPGTFPCQVRTGAEDAALVTQEWGGGQGRWERDVFIMARPRSLAGFTAQAADDLLANDIWFPEHGDIKHVVEHPVVLPVRLAARQALEIAISVEHVKAAVGPFPVPAAVLTKLIQLDRAATRPASAP
jgi:hypothetical protein